MNEKLISRVSRLISGSLNNVVDTLEKRAPKIVMEDVIREVSNAIAEVRVELGRVIAEKHLTHVRIAEEEHQHTSLNSKISIALNNQREDLAEAAIAQLLVLENQKQVLESKLENCIQQEQELHVYIKTLEEKRQGMNNALSRLILSQQTQGNHLGKQDLSLDDYMDQAELTFDRLLEKQIASNRPSLLIDRTGAVQLVELEALSNQDAIKKRLEQLKSL